MAKWDFKIVGASFVKELVPVDGDVNPRSQSFMQPSFHLEGGKIVIKESGQYVTAIYFPQIGEIDGVAPTDIDDANAKLLTLVENFNGGEGTPQNLAQVLAIDNKTNNIHIISNNGLARVKLNDEYLQLEYGAHVITLSLINGLQLYSDIQVFTLGPAMAAIIDNVISYTCPSFLLNTEEVATQPYADAKVANDLTASTTVAPSKTAVLTEYDMITGLTFSGAFALDKKGGRSYLPYTQTGSLTLSIGGSPIIGSFAVLRFTADGSAITGYAGWKLLSSDAITATNGVVHRVIVYQYEDEIWYSVKLN